MILVAHVQIFYYDFSISLLQCAHLEKQYCNRLFQNLRFIIRGSEYEERGTGRTMAGLMKANTRFQIGSHLLSVFPQEILGSSGFVY